MEDWIYRIMNARNPDWRTLASAPKTGAAREARRELETLRRER
jgi:hypothetical protein